MRSRNGTTVTFDYRIKRAQGSGGYWKNHWGVFVLSLSVYMPDGVACPMCCIFLFWRCATVEKEEAGTGRTQVLAKITNNSSYNLHIASSAMWIAISTVKSTYNIIDVEIGWWSQNNICLSFTLTNLTLHDYPASSSRSTTSQLIL